MCGLKAPPAHRSSTVARDAAATNDSTAGYRTAGANQPVQLHLNRYYFPAKRASAGPKHAEVVPSAGGPAVGALFANRLSAALILLSAFCRLALRTRCRSVPGCRIVDRESPRSSTVRLRIFAHPLH